jgi:hypothetical protein
MAEFAPSLLRTKVSAFLWLLEPHGVIGRKKRRFKRRRFWSAGVFEIISFDQHDKWRRFGLYLHIGVDPFSGRVLWLKIWWTNRNPVLITSYWLAACRLEKGCPSHIIFAV